MLEIVFLFPLQFDLLQDIAESGSEVFVETKESSEFPQELLEKVFRVQLRQSLRR